jgi:hypothetical protein
MNKICSSKLEARKLFDMEFSTNKVLRKAVTYLLVQKLLGGTNGRITLYYLIK